VSSETAASSPLNIRSRDQLTMVKQYGGLEAIDIGVSAKKLVI
jgi:hypothetical protein